MTCLIRAKQFRGVLQLAIIVAFLSFFLVPVAAVRAAGQVDLEQDARLERLAADLVAEVRNAEQLRLQLSEVRYLLKLAGLKDVPEEAIAVLFQAEAKANAGIANRQRERLAQLRGRVQAEMKILKDALAGLQQAAEFAVVRDLEKEDAALARLQQEKLEGGFEQALAESRRALAASPPPAEFVVLGENLRLRLAGSGKNRFYIGTAPVSAPAYGEFLAANGRTPASAGNPEKTLPVPAVGVSQADAMAFCAWLGQAGGGTYSLPSTAQLRAAKVKPNVALWTRDEWEEADFRRGDVLARFGVKFATVWDGAGLLQKQEAFGELPFATSDKLGFMVVTDVRTGVEQRLDWVRKQMKSTGK